MNANNQGSQSTNVYHQWHSHKHHKLVHWLIFIAIVIIVGLFLLYEISSWLKISTDTGFTIKIAKPSAILSLDPQTATVSVGDSFSANIILDTASAPIDAVDIYALHFDPSILDIVDDIPTQKGVQIQPGVIIPFNAANTVDLKTGTIKFGQLSAGGSSFTGKGILATIHFKAKAVGSSILKFDFSKGKTTDTNAAHKGKDQLTTVIDGLYTVQAK